jgi:prevent-host-death family protein
MKASILDLRRRMADVLRAVERGEPVTILHRGKEKAVLVPAAKEAPRGGVAEHEAFGIWKDRDDLREVDRFVRELREGRFDAL